MENHNHGVSHGDREPCPWNDKHFGLNSNDVLYLTCRFIWGVQYEISVDRIDVNHI